MLKQYLIEHNISIYRLADISGVPYTTLNELVNGKKNIYDCRIKTILKIADALNISIETLLNIFDNKEIVLSNSWEDNKQNKYQFPIIIKNDNYECSRIHPLMQKKINDVYKVVSKEETIEKVIVFGSSINIRCNNKSDIDLAIQLKDKFFTLKDKNKISEKIQEAVDYNADIIWLNTIDLNSQLSKDIEEFGVTIFNNYIE